MRNHIKELIIVTAIAGLFANPAIAQERPGQNPEVERPGGGGGGGRPAPYNPGNGGGGGNHGGGSPAPSHGGGGNGGGNPGHGGGGAPTPSPRPNNPAPAPRPSNPTPPSHGGGNPGGNHGGGNPSPRPNNPAPSNPTPAPRPNNPAPAPRPSNPTPPSHNGGGDNHGGGENHGGGDNHGGGNPGNNAGFHHRSDDDIKHNRDQVSHERQGYAGDMARRHSDMQNARNSWRNSYHVNIVRDINAIHNAARWADRLTRWETGCVQPPSRYFNNIRWIYPMPSETSWSYAQLDVVSSDLENLSRDIYAQMAQVAYSTPNREYSARLMNVLGQLVDAAENYDDAVDNSYDWSDSLDDLFYLDNTLTTAEQTLDGYSQAYLVQNQMEALRYYVNQLLWTYHQNY